MNPSHLFLLVTTALSSCGRQNSTSDLSDIYRNDAAMRKPSTKEEIKWTVSLDGCTGSMLSETKLLTANHCAPRAGAEYTSGAALAAGESTDLKAVKVVESSKSLDYSIVEVTWVKPLRKLEQRYTPAIQTMPEQVTVGLDTNPLTSNLITIGFPTDKTGSQTARGFAKKLEVQSLLYNVGTINGNSGGAVWKLPEMLLVSQTNFGTHAFGQPGWNNNNPESSPAWNGGSRMDVIYNQSVTLKDIFPQGKNRFTDESGHLISSVE